MRIIVSAALAAAFMFPGLAASQEPPAATQQEAAPAVQPEERRPAPPGANVLEAIVHRDTLFNGPFVSVTNAQPNLNLGWDARSIRVRSGEWQICTARNYAGRCTTITRDQPTLNPQFRTILSMRPTGAFGTGVGQSLRGASAEFFPAPLRDGQRIQCEGGSSSNCARQAANQFCRSVGWVVARTQTTETVSGRVYVADVLCARSIT
ncbi:beta/gamma crystallin [Novosphingobium sp. PhB165]|uniref:beta/gamma crystallin-related protein n=1 Tax=Novosphingobium sp. PhB165 TaxID=2485105 RepID=UPI00104A02D9|nr:beta/gamma crystallin-related protein [Novosphingobium sp. PhB165]TCM20431.1 beta/gamma crystallin [Novosphingobium sp. PhB165]